MKTTLLSRGKHTMGLTGERSALIRQEHQSVIQHQLMKDCVQGGSKTTLRMTNKGGQELVNISYLHQRKPYRLYKCPIRTKYFPFRSQLPAEYPFQNFRKTIPNLRLQLGYRSRKAGSRFSHHLIQKALYDLECPQRLLHRLIS